MAIVFKSYEQILSSLIQTYSARMGIDSSMVGGPIRSFFETVALEIANNSGASIQVLRDRDIDRATGDTLKRIAKDEGVEPLSSRIATGTVTMSRASTFTKISTKIYSGTNPPNIGSTSVNVSDASSFTATGTVYLGRGTPNVEAVTYSSKTQVGGYWTLVTSPTTKYHNLAETVILSQGGSISIPANTVVLAPGVGGTADSKYSVITNATLLDGEASVSGIQVNATALGASFNAPIGAVRSFASPISGISSVTNTSAFSTGRDSETDDQLRVRIKLAMASRGLGTTGAIKAATIGAQSSDEQAIIVANEMILGTNQATLYIDDGTSYEAKFQGVGVETVVGSAIGGEKNFQLATGGRQAPVTLAFLESTLTAPFDLINGDTLAVTVGTTVYEHVFATADFLTPGAATGFEITTSINANSALNFEATTSGNGSLIVLRSKDESEDSLEISAISTAGRDAAVQIGFPTSREETLRLYKNKVPLNKNGSSASVNSQNQSVWQASITDATETLIVAVDGTAPIIYTPSDANFLATGLYATVQGTNSLASWAQVFNNIISGVTTTVEGQQLVLTSNKGATSEASITVSGTLVTSCNMFSSVAPFSLTSTGVSSDFTLLRNVAQFTLNDPLVAGDELSAGTTQTEARIEGSTVSSGSLTLAADAHLWALLDATGTIIPTALTAGSTITASVPEGAGATHGLIKYVSSVTGAFTDVSVGDYVIVWSAELSAGNRTEGRVYSISTTTVTDDTLQISAAHADQLAAWAVDPETVTFQDGFVVLRSTSAPQKFRVLTGTSTLDAIATSLQGQTNSLEFSVITATNLLMRSKTKNSSGSILIVTTDVNGALLGFTNGDSSSSTDSLVAYQDSQKETQFPAFFHSTFSSDGNVDTPDANLSAVVSVDAFTGRDPADILSPLHPYGAISDAQSYGEYAQISFINLPGSLGISTETALQRAPNFRRVRKVDSSTDRFFLLSPLDFGSTDTAVVIVDNDIASKSFEVPLYRQLLTFTAAGGNSTHFSAYDKSISDTAVLTNTNTFGGSTPFDFSNFKALMQAKKSLKHQAAQSTLLYRATKWGRSGEKITVGYTYPAVANSAISSVVTLGDTVDVRMNLKSGAAFSKTEITLDSTTTWTVSVTTVDFPVAGIDQVKFTAVGGTAPSLGALVGGEYVNITTQTDLSTANTGIFKLSEQGGIYAPTATTFTVGMKTGTAVAEAAKATGGDTAITFYNASATTAAEMSTYVAANLTDYFTATIVDDGGTTGSGILTYSTYEDSIFSSTYVSLLDGVNWIKSSSLNSNPQFTFKKALSLTTDTGYNFLSGEEIRISPTMQEQVRRFLNVLAVTGLSSVGTISVAERGSKLEIASSVLGSSGAVQVSGGLANYYSLPILDSSLLVSSSAISASVNKTAGRGIHSDQWFKLEATSIQNKLAMLDSAATLTITASSPVAGKAKVALSFGGLAQRRFGTPRHHIRTVGRTFRIEKQGDLVCLSWNGSETSPGFQKTALNINDGSYDVSVSLVSGTQDSRITITSNSVTNFNELSIGDFVTCKIPSTLAANGINSGTFVVTGVSNNGKILQITNPTAEISASESLIAGDIAASSGVKEGDILYIPTPTSDTYSPYYTSAPFATTFASANRGKFRVIRSSGNSVWFENANAVEEEVTLGTNAIVIGETATTRYAVTILSRVESTETLPSSGSSLMLTWAQVGTQPALDSIKMGDIVTIPSTSAFAAGNQSVSPYADGFMALRSGTIGTVTLATTGTTNATNQLTGIASLTGVIVGQLVIAADIPVGTTIKSIDSPTVVTLSAAATGSNVGEVVTFYPSLFVECVNPLAVADNNVAGSNTVADQVSCHRPQIQFLDYDATIAGDTVNFAGDVLLAANNGSFVVDRVIDKNNAIIIGTLTSTGPTQPSDSIDSVYIEEENPYSGYKKVLYASAQPGAPQRTQLAFDSTAQYQKINQGAGVTMSSLNKLNFPTSAKIGLDAYTYNTGLIAEANRIIYGDPRNPVDYPGVGAAGSNVFVREFLTRRVQVSIVVRLKTGVPFQQVASQIRSSVSSLINSNPAGQSIPISSIVSIVNSIPGVTSDAILSPTYDAINDLILIYPNEKGQVLDPSSDITVSLVGT